MQQAEIKFSIREKMYRWIVEQKLNNTLGFLLLALFALLSSAVLVVSGITAGAVLLGVFIGIPMLIVAGRNLEAGLIILLLISFPLLGFKKLFTQDIPFGLVMDAIIGAMVAGLLLKQLEKRDWSFLNNPISYVTALWIGYNVLVFFNPWADSYQVWFYTVRTMAGYIILFFIALYAIKNLKSAERVFSLIIILSALAGFYGIFQEVFGFRGFEYRWIVSDDRRHELLFQAGRFRIFSFLSDPTVFGILMACMSLATSILITGPFSKKIKIFLGIATLAMLVSMVYSGTRTAYVILPAGWLFYSLLVFRKKLLMFTAALAVAGAILIVMPSGNPLVFRVQSAFNFDDDASFQLRLQNQEFIQPFIQQHPIGAGLGSTGIWGTRFSPDSPLAQFPPDSGFIRIAVELGWIGLIIYLLFLYVILRTGIRGFYNSEKEKIKCYYAAVLTIIFALVIAHYPQEAISQTPISMVFSILMALVVKLQDFNKEVADE